MLEVQDETEEVFHLIKERNGPRNKIIFVKSTFLDLFIQILQRMY